MKRLFFDANVFNRIIDWPDGEVEDWTGRVASRIEFVTSVLVLQELLLTPTICRRQRLAACALSLVSGKIIKFWNQLVREEVQSFLKGEVAPNVFLSPRMQRECLLVLKNAAEREAYDLAKFAQLSDQANKGKKQTWCKQKDLGKQAKGWAVGQPNNAYGADFERFCEGFRSHWPDQIRLHVNADVGALRAINQSLHDLPHLHAVLRIGAAWKFSEGMGRKPKRNDRADFRNMICAATCDLFASEETGLREIFEWVYPKKQFVTLESIMKSPSFS